MESKLLTAADLFKQYRLLVGAERDLVYLLAVAYTPLPISKLDKALQSLGVTKSFKTLAKSLLQAGIIESGNHFNAFHGQSYHHGPGAVRCAPSVVERVARQLAAEGRFGDLAEVVTTAEPSPKAYGTRYNFESVGQLLRFARMAF